jgi:4-carboxymuconolactone decarboxylase
MGGAPGARRALPRVRLAGLDRVDLQPHHRARARRERHYLINPYGLNYNEVTATNLVKINLAGEVMDGSKYPVNVAGFVIHSAIHGAREDAHCVIHTHTTAGSAVSCKREGLRFDNFYSATLYGQVAYHDFEGVTTDLAEQPRLVKSLGAKPILILRNHGLLVACGSIPEAYLLYWTLQRACEIQVADRCHGRRQSAHRAARARRNACARRGVPLGAAARRAALRCPAAARGHPLRRPHLNGEAGMDKRSQKERFDDGLKTRREVLGAGYVDKAMAGVDDFSKPFVDLLNTYCWNDIWNRPGLDRKTRSMLNLAMLSALGKEHELKLHINGALNNGVTKEQIREVLLQVAIYCGVPAAVVSFRCAREVFKERGV